MAAITEQSKNPWTARAGRPGLCGTAVSSAQVSWAAALLSEVLEAWLEENIPEGLTVFDFPRQHWRRLRTTNNLERASQEIKLGMRVTRFLPGKEAYLQLVSVILIEISEEWATGRAYLALEDGGDGSAPERSVGHLAEGILHRLRAHISHERST